MNLRDLHYVESVARLKSFSKAAEACFVSQPTLSAQIKKLEETLGVALFERSSKSVMLTAEGVHLLPTIRNILAEVSHLRQQAKGEQDPFTGELKLGAFPTLSTYIFPKLVPSLSKRFPKLELTLFEEKTADLILNVKDGALDAALLALPIAEDGLEHAECFEDQFFFAVSKQHAYAKKNSITLAQMRNKPLLLLDEGHCLRDQALEVCRLSGAREAQSFRATGLETIREMVKIGVGMTLIPEIARREGDGIRYIPITPAPKRVIGLVWRKSSPRATLMRALAEQLKGIAA